LIRKEYIICFELRRYKVAVVIYWKFQ